jgi:hypothetical protein
MIDRAIEDVRHRSPICRYININIYDDNEVMKKLLDREYKHKKAGHLIDPITNRRLNYYYIIL